jgi:hypothetical protein
MAHDVFISYSSEDKTVADAVCATLESRKIRCWIAPRDVTLGQPFAASLINAVKSSRVMVLVLSEDSNQSQYVLRELNEAVDKGIPIIPFRIEDVDPSEELRFYIKSLHWLDAMDPPLERHLKRLADSVQALLSVGEEDQPPEIETVVVASVQKRRSIPVWAIALIGLAVVIVLGVVGIWVVPRLNSALPSPTSTAVLAVADPIDIPNPETTPSPEISVEPEWSDWRTLSFNIPNDTTWSRTEENTYTAFTGYPGHSIAWSDETIDGNLILSLDIGSTGNRASGTIIIYGDGAEFSDGNLIFTLSNGIFWVEKHTVFHEGENFLAVYESDLDFQDRIFALRIEIVDERAIYFVDGEKVASFFIPSDIRRSGRIGITQHWEELDDRTYSNIKIKTSNAVSVVVDPTDIPFPATNTPTQSVVEWFINQVEIDEFRFFNAGEDPNVSAQRDYSHNFGQANARVIYCELDLYHTRPGENKAFVMQAVYYDPDGVVYGDVVIEPVVEAGRIKSNWVLGYGWDDPGNWDVGTYRVDVYVGEEKITSDSFEIQP